MVTGFFLSSSGGGAGSARAAIGSPLSGSQRRWRQSDERRRRTALIAAASSVVAILIYAWLGLAGEAQYLGDDGSRERWEEGAPVENSSYSIRQQRSTRRKPVHPSSIETVVRYLTQLAKTNPSRLYEQLGMESSDYGDDPFSLQQLEKGLCPWTSEETVEWLPPRPHNSDEIAAAYRNNGAESGRKRGAGRSAEGGEVAIWYEHLSKAGGTTFCGLAKSNMLNWEVPRYHCMPGKLDARTGRKLLDGRVGTWSNDELIQHVRDNGHRVVSNEWEPFPVEKLAFSNRQLDGSTPSKNNSLRSSNEGLRLLFVTTLREPSDRLLSAFTFFGLTVTEGRREERGKDPPTFHEWIASTQGRLRRYNPGSMVSFRANTARYNHIVWRFSGGKLAGAGRLQPDGDEEWEGAFADAARALMQHDLVLPMDVMSKDGLGKEALRDLLGWTNFRIEGRQTGKGDREGGHVVTAGGIKNSNARDYFDKEEYKELWKANWLDHILYLWCRAVFLARLHCADRMAGWVGMSASASR